MDLSNLFRSQGLVLSTVCAALAIVLIAGFGFNYEKSCEQSLPNTCNWPSSSSVSSGQLYFEPLAFLPSGVDINLKTDYCSRLDCVEAAAFYMPCHTSGLKVDDFTGIAFDSPSLEPHCAAVGCGSDQCLEIAYGCSSGEPRSDMSATFSCKLMVYKRDLMLIPFLTGIVVAIIGVCILTITIFQTYKYKDHPEEELKISKDPLEAFTDHSYSDADSQQMEFDSALKGLTESNTIRSESYQSTPETFKVQTYNTDEPHKEYSNSRHSNSNSQELANEEFPEKVENETPILIVTSPPGPEEL